MTDPNKQMQQQQLALTNLKRKKKNRERKRYKRERVCGGEKDEKKSKQITRNRTND